MAAPDGQKKGERKRGGGGEGEGRREGGKESGGEGPCRMTKTVHGSDMEVNTTTRDSNY